jgi:hypothetical protein
MIVSGLSKVHQEDDKQVENTSVTVLSIFDHRAQFVITVDLVNTRFSKPRTQRSQIF